MRGWTQAFLVSTAYILEVLQQLLLWEYQTGRSRGMEDGVVKKARNNYVEESLDSLLVSQSMLQQ